MAANKARRSQPDWPMIHRELKRPGVTLQLWQEHRTAHPRRLRLQPVLRALPGLGRAAVADHAANERGRRAHVRGLRRHHDRLDRRCNGRGDAGAAIHGRSRRQQRHLRGSAPNAGAGCRIGSHTRTFAFLGGVMSQIVSENLKSGITKVCFTSRRSTASMRRWPLTTTPRSCRRRATKPRPKWRCWCLSFLNNK